MKKIWIVLLVLILPIVVCAQNTGNKNNKQAAKATTIPSWAGANKYDATAHAYFPDYYVFYDPKRGGYAFWENGKWRFSPSVPPFMEKVDMSRSRVKILKGISLDLHPELNYPYYMKLYPPDGNNNTLVPVPIPGNPAGN